MINVFSSGGLGDFFIVYLKIQDILREQPDEKIHWKHIESNDIVPKLIQDIMENSFLKDDRIIVKPECDENYSPEKIIKKYKNELNTIILNTRQDGNCPFYSKGRSVINPFLNIEKPEPFYDVCIQYSSGAKQSRKWNFHPYTLVMMLRRMKYKVALIGITDEENDFKHIDDFVNKLTLSETMKIVHQSKLVISLSGFISYLSLVLQIPSVRLMESSNHEQHYINEQWTHYSYIIQYPSFAEVIKGLRHYGIKV